MPAWRWEASLGSPRPSGAQRGLADRQGCGCGCPDPVSTAAPALRQPAPRLVTKCARGPRGASCSQEMEKPQGETAGGSRVCSWRHGVRLLIASLDGPSIISSHRTSSLWFRMGFVGQALAGVKIGMGCSLTSSGAGIKAFRQRASPSENGP